MKYIEIAVADSFDDNALTTFDALEKAESITPASPVGRGEMKALLIELREDVRAAFGTNQDGDEIDADASTGLTSKTLTTALWLYSNALNREPYGQGR